MQEEIINGYQVESDGRRVWVNSPTTGASVARFSIFENIAMVDVHHEPHEQKEKGERLDCAHGECSIDLWLHFKRALRTHYEIEMPDSHMPEILNVKKTK